MDRPGMQALIEHIKRGGVDCVLAYRLDRLTRLVGDHETLEKLLEEYKVRVLYTNDLNPDDSPMGKFVRHMMVAQAQLERGQTIQRINDKHLELLKQGYHAGGYPPFGYVSGEKKNTLAVDPNAAAQAKEIFSLYNSGKRPSEVADVMLKKYTHVPIRHTRNGKRYGGALYCENFIRRVLANPVYAGYVHRKGSELYKGLHEAIVDKELWNSVQKKLEEAQKKQTPEIRQRALYLLKGKLFCDCGAAMTCGASGKTKKDGLYYYYICSGRNRERTAHKCQTSISAKILEAVVFSALGHIATTGMTAKEIKESAVQYESEVQKERKVLSKKLSKRSSELKQMTARFARMTGNEVLQSALAIELDKASKEIETMQSRVAEIDIELEGLTQYPELSAMQTKSLMENLDILQSDLTTTEKIALLKSAVSKLTMSVQHRNGFKRKCSLKIIPTAEYVDQIGVLDIAFDVDTSKGKSLWQITSPFELKCDSYGQIPKAKTSQKIKRHWLHKVVDWQKQIATGSTQEDIAKKAGVGKTMVCRKLKLLERLHYKVLEKLLSLKYERDTEVYSFRILDKLAKLPKAKQYEKMLYGKLI